MMVSSVTPQIYPHLHVYIYMPLGNLEMSKGVPIFRGNGGVLKSTWRFVSDSKPRFPQATAKKKHTATKHVASYKNANVLNQLICMVLYNPHHAIINTLEPNFFQSYITSICLIRFPTGIK